MEITGIPVAGNEAIVIQVTGEVDLYSAPHFAQYVAQEMGHSVRHVLLDLTRLEYLDSSGVGAIIRIVQATKSRKGSVGICGLSGMPQKVLEMCNIISILEIFPSADAALKKWSTQWAKH